MFDIAQAGQELVGVGYRGSDYLTGRSLWTSPDGKT